MKEKNKIIAGSLITLLGILGVFATFISMPKELVYLKPIIIIIGFFLLILASFFFISYHINLLNAWSILRMVKKLGIMNIYENGLGNEEQKTRIIKAKNIKIISTTGLIFFRTCEEEIISALVNNARLSLILSSRDSLFNSEIESFEQRTKGEINDELRQVSAILNRITNEAKKRTNDQTTGIITIKYFNTQLRMPMILIDDEYLWLTLTLPPKRSTQSHSFEILKKESSLTLSCNKHFDEMWALLPNSKEISKMTFEKFFDGIWKLEYDFGNSRGLEYFKIVDNKYYIDGEYVFNIDQVEFDYENKKVSFRKVGVKQNDNRKLINVLTIDSDNKLTGLESGNTKMIYYRT